MSDECVRSVCGHRRWEKNSSRGVEQQRASVALMDLVLLEGSELRDGATDCLTQLFTQNTQPQPLCVCVCVPQQIGPLNQSLLRCCVCV